jgi:hypothetical protein
MTENTTKDTPAAVPVTALPPDPADMKPELTREFIIGELARRYVGPAGRVMVGPAVKANPGWGAVLGGIGARQTRVAVSAEVFKHPDYNPARSPAFDDVRVRSRMYAGVGRAVAPAYLQQEDVAREITALPETSRNAIMQRGFHPAHVSQQPYSDGMPYCPHCGGYTQPWNRAYNAARTARAAMGDLQSPRKAYNRGYHQRRKARNANEN